jgi:hypothetical protein
VLHTQYQNPGRIFAGVLMLVTDALFNRYAERIHALPDKTPLPKAQVLCPTFCLRHAGDLAAYYCPMEYLNPQAKIILVGITPGWTQMEIAFRVARDGLRRGETPDAVCRRVDQCASFAGGMRHNLVTMLDEIGVPAALGVASSMMLFAAGQNLAHTTSLLRYPVFIRQHNYTGHTPDPLSVPLLRHAILARFVPEMALVPAAVIIPLGMCASTVCAWLIAQGHLPQDRCLLGFPHPSGANGHRVAQFAAMRPFLQHALAQWFARAHATKLP